MTRKVYAVFGNPVLHSCSPQLFNSVFSEIPVEAYYTRIRPANAANIPELIRHLNLAGANITTPFKTEVMTHLDWLSDEAEIIGGVNTIINNQGCLKGYNTDYLGVSRSLQEAGLHLQGSRCLVLGAGPAACAAVYALINEGADVTVVNRTNHKAKEIANRFGCSSADMDKLDSAILECDILVSALLPEANPLANIKVPEWITAIDANYRASTLSQHLALSGCRTITGKRWLLHQAAASFNLFLNFNPKIELMAKGLEAQPQREAARYQMIGEDTLRSIHTEDFDMLVSVPDSSTMTFRTILDEEISKAFVG